jgi:hypothetical protein
VNLTIDNDELVEVLIDTLPDMTIDELTELEFAIGVELQERAHQVQQLDLFDYAY